MCGFVLSRRSIMKKMFVILVMASVALFGVLSAGNATADDNSIVGSWVVNITFDPPGPPPVRNLATFTKDGGNLASDPDFGSGNGVWKKVGPKTFATKFLTIVPTGFDPPFPPGTIITVTAHSLVLDKSGDVATGPFQTVFADPTNGAVIVSLTGSVILTRITLAGP
jgi:hypothetical protein